MSIPDHAGNDAAQNATNESAAQGPQVELPDAAPDFVSEIHAAINDFLAGGAETLGEVVSGIATAVDLGGAASVLVDVTSAVPV